VPLRQRAGSRLAAFLLAALFVGAVGGAADADALLFHTGHGHAALMGPHYEPGGSPDHHADHCLLTFRIHTGRRPAPRRFPVRFEGIPQHAAARRPAAAPHRFYPGLHQESRAPPTSSV
jgi:hypothetical protein